MHLYRLNLILVPSVLALASPAWAEARPAPTKPSQPRPLNLSLPHDVLHTPDAGQVDATIQRNLRAPAPVEGSPPPPARLRYGAGYEQRQQDMGGAASGGAPAGGAASGAGAGRRGR